jgi:hypothetical protein
MKRIRQTDQMSDEEYERMSSWFSKFWIQ